MIAHQTLAALALSFATAGATFAGSHDESEHGAAGHAGHGAAEAPAATPATEAFSAANAAMHAAMNIEFSGDADLDFARGMIAHHQGAIDMARVVLEHGDDPELRGLAEEIIAVQEAEIAFLRDWIAEHGG